MSSLIISLFFQHTDLFNIFSALLSLFGGHFIGMADLKFLLNILGFILVILSGIGLKFLENI